MGEIYEQLKSETLPEISTKLRFYSMQAKNLYNQIEQQEQLYKQQQQQIEQYNKAKENEKLKPWEYETKGSLTLQEARENLINLRENLNLNTLYLNGYKLLNEIGHYFHGEWNYTIVLFGETSYTFTLSEEDFIQMTHAEVEGFRLNDSMSIINQLKNTQAATKWDTEEAKQKGYDTKIWNNYKYVIKRAKKILARGQKDVNIRTKFNSGEQLEGYLALIEQNQIQELQICLENLHEIAYNKAIEHLGLEKFNLLHMYTYDIITALNRQTNQRGFWTGGDTKKHGQIKGQNASVFSFSTIRNQLLKVSSLFEKINFSKLVEKMQQAKPEAKKSLLNQATKIMKEVTAGFDARIIQDINAYTDDINQEIDKLFAK